MQSIELYESTIKHIHTITNLLLRKLIQNKSNKNETHMKGMAYNKYTRFITKVIRKETVLWQANNGNK